LVTVKCLFTTLSKLYVFVPVNKTTKRFNLASR
jgi:hypothetical protein